MTPTDTLQALERYAAVILPGLVVAEQIGIPLPAVPALLAVGALAAIAPEGTVNLFPGELQRVRSGIARIALPTHAPVIPVGIWGAQLGAPAIWVLPITFPLVMAFGGVLGVLRIPLPMPEAVIALSALVLGAAVVAGAMATLRRALDRCRYRGWDRSLRLLIEDSGGSSTRRP